MMWLWLFIYYASTQKYGVQSHHDQLIPELTEKLASKDKSKEKKKILENKCIIVEESASA